jgi:hypothetical protein
MSGQLKEFASLEIGPILQINVPKLMLSAGVQVSKSISIDLTWMLIFSGYYTPSVLHFLFPTLLLIQLRGVEVAGHCK